MGKLNMLGKNLINTKNNNLMLEVSFHLSPFGSDTLHLTLKSERMKRKKKKTNRVTGLGIHSQVSAHLNQDETSYIYRT